MLGWLIGSVEGVKVASGGGCGVGGQGEGCGLAAGKVVASGALERQVILINIGNIPFTLHVVARR